MKDRRRRWLLLLVAAVAVVAGGHVEAARREAFRFAAVADTHIADDHQLARFRQLVYTLGQRDDVDFLLMLGDICGHAPEMLPGIKNVIEHAGLDVYTVSGNHDDNYARNTNWYESIFERMYYAFDHKGWRFVMNWSQNQPAEWVTQTLAATDPAVPVVFCQHYPPGQTDDVLQQEPWASIVKHGNVRLILSGHWHRFDRRTIGAAESITLGACGLGSWSRRSLYYLFDAKADGTVTLASQHTLAELKTVDPPDKAPVVTIASPSAGTTISGEVTLNGTSGDDTRVHRVEYSVDYGLWRRARGNGTWYGSVDASKLGDGHHLVAARAVDNAGQYSLTMAETLLYVQNQPVSGERTYHFQQGIDGYDGCRSTTVRKHDGTKNPSGSDGTIDDLENWAWSSGEREFSEFYIRFDLSKSGIPADAKIKRVTMTLYGSRQNHVDSEGKQCGALVGVVGQAWDESITFANRPATPGWFVPANPDPAPALKMVWPYLGGRQLVWPPKAVLVDLTPIADVVHGWITRPQTNHGLVFSPAHGWNYNMSAKSSHCEIRTARPKLTIELE